MPVKLNCQRCGKEFSRKPSRVKPVNYCSPSCYSNQILKQCARCEKEYSVNPARAETAKYCSKECKYGSHIKLICQKCNKEFLKKPYEAKTAKFCSFSCARKSEKIEKTCQRCEKTFYILPYRNNPNKKFCSIACARYGWQVEKKCQFCQQVFSVNKAKKETAKFCSTICAQNGGKVTKICKVCKKEFSRSPEKAKKAKYCSSKCQGLDNRTIPLKTCENCGKTHRKKDCKKYCSLKCRREISKKNGQRTCENCKKIFYISPSNPDKYCSQKCYFQYRNKPEKKCIECLEVFSLDFFPKRRKICKKCFKIKYKLKIKASNQLMRSKRNGAKGKFTAEQWLSKLEFFGYRCYLCRKPLNEKETHAEHRKPISRGGTNWISNIAPACKDCNLRKNNKTEKEFRALISPAL